MSVTTITKVEKRADYPVVEFKKKGKLILTNEVLAQIFFLHSNVGKIEWSGILLYEVISGSPADPENFVLKAKHIFLMDIGTAGATSYEMDGDIVDIYDKIPEAMEMKIGQIHTHHTMDTFFSGTDTDELQINVDKHNYYLSLIVNMSGNYNAKVAFVMEKKTKSSISYTGDSGALELFEDETEEKAMGQVNMQIVMDYESELFYGRLTQVKKNKEDAEKKQNQSKMSKKDREWYQDGKGHWRQYHKDYQQEFYYPNGLENGTKKDFPSPFSMTDKELERLTSNIISVTPELTEERTAYALLMSLAGGTTDDLDFYAQYLETNINTVFTNFFDRSLTFGERKYVVTELVASVNRYSGNKKVRKFVNKIKDILTSYGTNVNLNDFREKSETVSDDELNAEIESLKR